MEFSPDDGSTAPPGLPTTRVDRLAARLSAWSKESPLAQKARARYEKVQRFQPLAFFFGGVVWDGATLRRIDAWGDTTLLLLYLLILGGLILMAMLVQHGQVEKTFFTKYEEWYPSVIQFFLGALFSAYFIFYFQSASLTASSLYVLVLVALLVANEFLHSRLLNPYLLFTLYFVASSSFFIYFIPILTRSMGYGVFLVGGMLSAALVAGMLYFLFRKSVLDNRSSQKLGIATILVPFILLNVFYLNNWIPPVPISLKEGKIYRTVQKVDSETYTATYETPPWYAFWVEGERDFKYAEGDSVYCYAAIFAPTAFDAGVAHEWEWYDEGAEAWTLQDRIDYTVRGGRDGGYRGYTFKRFIKPGRWRVDVVMNDKKLLGRIPFTVVPADSSALSLTTRRIE